MLVNLFIFVLGAVVGSFINVCIYRLPRDKSIAFPPSHCPACSKDIAHKDLLPVLSYLALKGRCRHCGAPISWRYPLVELITGILFLMAALITPDYGLSLVFNLIFISLLIIIFFVDLEHQIIPDILSYIGLAVGLLYGFFNQTLMSSLIGAGLGLIIFLLIAALGKLLFKKEALGEGDIRLAVMLGAFLGWQMFLVAAFLSYLLGALISVPILVFKIRNFGEYLPFGPFMVAGGLISLFLGEQFILLYCTFFLNNL